MRRKESNLIINSLPSKETFRESELVEGSMIIDPEEAFKALVAGKSPRCDNQKMIEEDSVMPTYGCEFTFES